MLKNKYNAIVCNNFGSIDDLQYSTFSSIPLKNNQVRIQVKAFGINFPDKLMI